MSKIVGELKSFVGGIADTKKVGAPYTYAWGIGIDVRSDPSQMTINPRTVKASGSVVTDLPMWFDLACNSLYAYGDTGKIYREQSNSTWAVDHVASDSRGNGLVYFPEDQYLYYAQNTTIGRKSDPCESSGVYYDAFLENEGGEPTNAYSILFERDSSMYAYIADNAGLSITGDLTLSAYTKFASLPDTDEVYVIMSKWNEQSNQRSYKFDLTTKSDFFGDGRDGALNITSNTTEDPIDANCSGTTGQTMITVSNEHGSFSSVAAGDKVLIIQMRGSGAGQYQLTEVVGYSGGVLTILDPLTFSPSHSATASVAEKAQVRVIKQHTTVTVAEGITYTSKAWDGLKGGILAWFANSTQTINGTVTGTGKGFRGGVGATGSSAVGQCGEGTNGPATTGQRTSNGNGGGAGQNETGLDGISSEGGQGANANDGTSGRAWKNGGSGYSLGITSASGIGGLASGSDDLTTMTMGGAGGSGGNIFGNNTGFTGGNGGAIICMFAADIVYGANGSVVSDGTNGGYLRAGMAAGSGAGGSILIKTQTAALGTLLTSAIGGNSIVATASVGIIHAAYLTSVTGTSTPAYTSAQDPNLGSGDGYVLRLQISNNGTAIETYSWDVTEVIDATTWRRLQVEFDSSISTAEAFINGASLGTKAGSMTAIYDSTASFALAASFDSSGNAENFGDFRMDDARVFNDLRTSTELTTYNDRVLTGVEANLQAYYEFEQDVTDSQTNITANDLTAVNSPTYSTDVPFSGLSARADQDVTIDASGSTYTLGTSLSEAADDRQTFTPTKEPIKSIALNINDKGSGDWTVVVHDGLNREVASITVANAELNTGVYEFIFDEPFRPILTADYHVHVYDTTGDGEIVTSGLNDMEGSTGNTGAYLLTYYQILVNDEYHPMVQFLDFVAVGNERYIGKLEAGNIYNPHAIKLPAGYRVRCFAFWNEYLAIGTWKGDSITDTDQGKIFLWNGADDSLSLPPIDVPEGGINSMFGSQGALFIVAGYEGNLLVSTDGAHTQKIDQIPLLSRGEYMEVAPGAMCMWRSILRIGATINTDSNNVHQGIYGYGRLNTNYPYSMGFDHPLSIGDKQSSNVKVGATYASGQKLYAGWKNNNSFGIDSVSVTNAPYETARIELLISDLGKLTQWKKPLTYRVDFEPLQDGDSITLQYKKDRQEYWETIDESIEDEETSRYTAGTINDEMNEIQLAADFVCTSGISPVITQFTLEAEGQQDDISVPR